MAVRTPGRSVKLHEDEYAYDIMLRLARNLLTRGAKVHIIIQDAKDGIRDQQFLNNSKRETCMGSPIPLSQVSRLDQRCAKINSLSRKDKETYKRAIFIHVDSRSRHQRTDVFFYHKPKDQASKRLAKTMKSTFSRKYNRHQPGRGFSGTIVTYMYYVTRPRPPYSSNWATYKTNTTNNGSSSATIGKPWPTGFARVLSRIIIIIGSSIPNDLLY